jgi:CBS domain-containing protein
MLTRSVTHYLKSPVFTVSADADLETARQRLEAHNVSCLGVSVGPEPLAGVVSRSDLLRAGRYERSADGTSRLVLPAQIVRERMHSPVFTLEPSDDMATAAREMAARSVHRLFVRKQHTVFGVVGTLELMRALMEARVQTPVEALMSTPVGTIRAETPLSEAVHRLRSTGVTGLVVVTGERERPVGLFTQREALEASAHADDLPVDVLMSARFIQVHPHTALHYAAAQAAATRARHLLVMEGDALVGIVAGLDFAKAAD